MYKVIRVDQDGYYVEDVILSEDDNVPKDCITAEYLEGLHRPRWDGSSWVEGLDSNIIEGYKFESTYKKVLGGIEEKKKEENKKLFTYNGVKFVSDKDSIQATQNDALARPSNDPIRTMEGTPYEGNWMCDSGPVPFTNEEFIAFAAEYFLRGSANFTSRTMHKANVDAIYNTEGATSEDILSYDFLTGWYINL